VAGNFRLNRPIQMCDVLSRNMPEELKTWLTEQIEQHKVEPNSGLGGF